MSRIQPAAPGLLKTVLALPERSVGEHTVLEHSVALPNLDGDDRCACEVFKTRKRTRTQEAQNLIWALYNKVDFLFNY